MEGLKEQHLRLSLGPAGQESITFPSPDGSGTEVDLWVEWRAKAYPPDFEGKLPKVMKSQLLQDTIKSIFTL